MREQTKQIEWSFERSIVERQKALDAINAEIEIRMKCLSEAMELARKCGSYSEKMCFLLAIAGETFIKKETEDAHKEACDSLDAAVTNYLVIKDQSRVQSVVNPDSITLFSKPIELNPDAIVTEE